MIFIGTLIYIFINSISNILTGTGLLPCELKYLKIPLINHQVCQNTKTGQLYKKQSGGQAYPKTQICAGSLKGGKDTCQVRISNWLLQSRLLFKLSSE